MTARDLYDRDFFEWTQCNAALLRAGRLDQADLEHIAEEIEDMGKGQQRELWSRLEVLLAHLLKWRVQPEGRGGGSWRATINNQRREILRLFRQAPSLRRELPETIAEVYPDAMAAAVDETRLPRNCFPPTCPFTPDQILDQDFFPT